jgi:2-oxoisovalerate dehydrogenase E1 component
MRRIRTFEERALELVRSGAIPGVIHSSIGQEAVAVGATFDLGPDDCLTSSHRGHGHVIARGVRLGPLLAELMGKEPGLSRGRGGTMHLFEPALGVLGTNGIVGSGIPIAVGAALAMQLEGSPRVVVSLFGDGAVNTGAFHEAANLAALWQLPVVFVCENNQYAESTRFSDSVPTEDLMPRAASYGMPGRVIDGNDVAACLTTITEAVSRAREGSGPSLVQADTYRWHGHYSGDSEVYRDREEVETWKARDPLARLRSALLDAVDRGLETVDAEVADEVEDAVRSASSAPEPDPASVAENVVGPPRAGDRASSAERPAREVSFRRAVELALVDAMELDRRVLVIGQDVADPMGGSFRVTLGLSARFGTDRVRNTPISEAAIVGAAVGAALLGWRPVAEIMYVDFLTLAMDQLVNQAAFMRYMSGGRLSVPMVVRCQGGAGGSQGAQHSKSLEAWLVHVPGLKVIVPSTPNDAYWLLREAVEDDDPGIFVEYSSLYDTRGTLDTNAAPDDLAGPAVRRHGTHATVVTWGAATSLVLEAADRLAADGISVEVLDLRRLAPLPINEVVASVERTGLLAIAHEAWGTGGLGAEIAATVADRAFDTLEGPVRRITALPCPHPFSPVLERAMLPTVDRIERTVRGWFES